MQKEYVDRASLTLHMLLTCDKICPIIEFHAFCLTELSTFVDLDIRLNLEMPNASTSSSPSGVAVMN